MILQKYPTKNTWTKKKFTALSQWLFKAMFIPLPFAPHTASSNMGGLPTWHQLKC